MSTGWRVVPVFQVQSGDTFEFAQVASYEGQATRQGLPGDEDVLGAHGSAAGGQQGVNLPCVEMV